MADTIEKTDAEWREQLTPEQYRIMRQKGTEPAFSGKFTNTKTAGTYICAGCGEQLFSSNAKYDSRSGWPSFYQALDPAQITEVSDRSHGMTRTEVLCRRCGAHLGHLFDDGPAPSGMRYCINSASLDLKDQATDPE